jgi:TPR repeat protein
MLKNYLSIVILLFLIMVSYPLSADETSELENLRILAEQGDASAQYILAFNYSHGEGVTQDYKEAFKWYKLAADQGNTNAQYIIGMLYENGLGVEKNIIEANKWKQLAKDNGYVE